MAYRNKYLKYKNKYLELTRELMEGGTNLERTEEQKKSIELLKLNHQDIYRVYKKLKSNGTELADLTKLYTNYDTDVESLKKKIYKAISQKKLASDYVNFLSEPNILYTKKQLKQKLTDLNKLTDKHNKISTQIRNIDTVLSNLQHKNDPGKGQTPLLITPKEWIDLDSHNKLYKDIQPSIEEHDKQIKEARKDWKDPYDIHNERIATNKAQIENAKKIVEMNDTRRFGY